MLLSKIGSVAGCASTGANHLLCIIKRAVNNIAEKPGRYQVCSNDISLLPMW